MKKKPDNARSGKPRRGELILLGAILLAGALLRAGYLAEQAREPEFRYPAVDAAYHDHWARGNAFGEWQPREGFPDPRIRERPFFRPPGYAYLLGGIYRLAGAAPLTPRIFQAALGLLLAYWAFRLGREWFSPATGLAWAGMLALSWSLIYYEGELLGVTATVGAVMLSLAVLAGWRYRTGFFPGLAGGAALGLLALFRSNAVPLVLGAAAWLWWLKLRVPQRRFLPTLLGLAAGPILLILPVFLRNLLVTGEPVPLAANTGMSLSIGLNPVTDGAEHYLPGYGKFGSPFDYPAAVEKLSRSLGREVGYREASARYAGEAVGFVRERPGKTLKLLGKKALLFWGPAEVVNNRDIPAVRAHSPWLRWNPIGFPLLAAFALLGLTAWKLRPPGDPESSRRGELVTLLTGFVAVYFLSVLPAAAAARYRVPIVPPLALLGALGLVRFGQACRARHWPAAAGLVTVGAVLGILFFVNFAGYVSPGSKYHYDRAVAFEAAGDSAAAEGEYRSALAIDSGYGAAAGNLAAILSKRGLAGEALVLQRLALAAEPDSARAWSNLAQGLLETGKLEEAEYACERALEMDPGLAKALNNLGLVQARRGRPDQAEESFRAALEKDPAYPEAAYNLGNLLAESGREEEAEALLRRAAAARAGYAEALNNLGNLLASQGRLAEAAEAYRQALAGDKPPPQAWGNLANLRAAAGDYPGAEELYRRALAAAPDDPAVLENYGYTLKLAGRNQEAEELYRRARELKDRLKAED